MTNFATGAVRDTGGKGRMDLLPMCALLRISRHMENSIAPDPETGVPHYPERNWEQGLPMHSMIDSALRHLVKYADGQTDEDHLCAAATNLLMAMWTEEKRPDMQDIPSRPKKCSSKGGLPGFVGGKVPDQIPGQMTISEVIYSSLCNSYREEDGVARCFGTKHMERCTCGGNPAKCDFYPEKRTSLG